MPYGNKGKGVMDYGKSVKKAAKKKPAMKKSKNQKKRSKGY